jgi:hypothetical protein
VTYNDSRPSGAADGLLVEERTLPLVIATIMREEGVTGVHTHMRQLCRYLTEHGTAAILVTSFSWGRLLSYPVYALRPVLERYCGPVNVAWYRYWHEAFLRRALRRCLARHGACIVYAQDPLAARSAWLRLGPRARSGGSSRAVGCPW